MKQSHLRHSLTLFIYIRVYIYIYKLYIFLNLYRFVLNLVLGALSHIEIVIIRWLNLSHLPGLGGQKSEVLDVF